MPTDIIMPQMGESIVEGTITKWLKKPGDKVQRDEPLFEISTDKVDAEIPSPSAGVLKEIKQQTGATVTSQQLLAIIEEGAAAAAPAKSPPRQFKRTHRPPSRAGAKFVATQGAVRKPKRARPACSAIGSPRRSKPAAPCGTKPHAASRRLHARKTLFQAAHAAVYIRLTLMTA